MPLNQISSQAGLIASVLSRKLQLDELRPVSEASLLALQHSYDVDLTYTSNAIEGNTLTLRETAELIEHGITVGGKPLRDHLEALDHFDAVLWMRELVASSVTIDDKTICELHRRIVLRSQPDIAGIYSSHAHRIAGSSAIFPNPAKIPNLMEAFGRQLSHVEPTPQESFNAHFRLVAIHPFSDGNGRTARLLTNLMLLRAGYPPVAIRPEDRKTYLDSLEHASLSDVLDSFYSLMYERLDATLEDYVTRLLEVKP